MLHRELDDPELVEALTRPLPTDAECDLLAEHWHTMLAVWLRRNDGAERNAAALRARLERAGAGPSISTTAVEGFLTWWDRHDAERR
jgi:hypothetical protein